MLNLKLNAEGNTPSDIEYALEEALRLVRNGFTSGNGRNDTGSFNFELDGQIELSVAEVLKWLADNDIEETDLDDLVHDSAQKRNLDDLNKIVHSKDQESHIELVEEVASQINNGGWQAQLEFLKEDFDTMSDFVAFLKTELSLASSPMA